MLCVISQRCAEHLLFLAFRCGNKAAIVDIDEDMNHKIIQVSSRYQPADCSVLIQLCWRVQQARDVCGLCLHDLLMPLICLVLVLTLLMCCCHVLNPCAV